mgnify:CR=1 FL=1
MDNIIKKQIEVRKKISLNMNVVILDLVKELAKLTKTNNTLVIESLLVKGVPSLTKYFRDSWTAILYDTRDESKKDNLKKLLKDLKTISEKKEFIALIEA